jgi:hypothetical protein
MSFSAESEGGPRAAGMIRGLTAAVQTPAGDVMPVMAGAIAGAAPVRTGYLQSQVRAVETVVELSAPYTRFTLWSGWLDRGVAQAEEWTAAAQQRQADTIITGAMGG